MNTTPLCYQVSSTLRRIYAGTLACVALLAFATVSHAAEISIERPGEREFVRDLANLIDDATEANIKTNCAKLLDETATPIIVVTIDSMAQHGGEGLRIETFATLLFDQWGIGHEKLNGQQWNTGILLLVSKGDRKARIELGAGWGRDKDALCQKIMDEQIIPQFKAGNFSGGIESGVNALDKMARGLEIPQPKRPASHYLMIAAFVGLLIFTIVSLSRRGSSGWAWIFWGAVFAIVGAFLYHMLTSSGSSGGGGGGSFGGGFSGGGGASGSW